MPPQQWAAMLEQHGRVRVDRAAEEEKLKTPMVCSLTGTALDDIKAVREHVRSSAYSDAVSEAAAGASLLFATPATTFSHATSSLLKAPAAQRNADSSGRSEGVAAAAAEGGGPGGDKKTRLRGRLQHSCLS